MELTLGLVLAVGFVLIVHYILRPLVNALYLKYEPLLFHIGFVVRYKFQKVRKKLGIF